MITIQHLYQSNDELRQALQQVDPNRPSLVQIFTCQLEPVDAVALSAHIQTWLPLAHVVGTSVNGVIYRGEQYDQHTLITVEQYQHASLQSCLICLDDKTYDAIAHELVDSWNSVQPSLLRLYVGQYYDYAHQLIQSMNKIAPDVKIVGGMSGELFQSKTLPFVFNSEKSLSNGLIYAGVVGSHLSIYHRINTSHEPISTAFTITQTHDRAIDTIENEPALQWLQRNVGFLSTKQYDSWEDIANNDPLVRFQLSLEDHPATSRFLRFDVPTQQITQYFSRLDAGTKFRISYTSPAKCVEECKQTSLEVQETPMEQLFCYNCLFRKLYLKNCAQWELTPYHQNPVSGAFMLGEFGYNGEASELLNGSCVLCGIGEEDRYLSVDFTCLDQLESLHAENDGLMDFLIKKQKITKTKENDTILSDIITRETSYEISPYVDERLNIPNLLQYEIDKEACHFSKICLMKIENAEILLSYMGQPNYYKQLKRMTDWLTEQQNNDEKTRRLKVYVANYDAFVISASDDVSQDEFITHIRALETLCMHLQEKFGGTPFLTRFVLVFDHDFLLEQSYSQMRVHSASQSRMIISQNDEREKATTREELECINTIQYALLNNKVIPYYQGVYNNETKRIDKYEALMRIEDRNGNILAPGQFMDVSKKYRMYLELNLKMLQNVARDFSQIDASVSINLSAHDISSPKYREALFDLLEKFHKPSNLIIELLEDEYFSDMDALKKFINEVRKFGVKVAIDDFGSGYSNLLKIVKIHPDYFKIDGQIIKDLHKDFHNETIVEMISLLAKKLSIDLVAEFVENEEIQAIVEKHGIRHSQGYYFSKPQPFSEVYRKET